MTTIAASAKLAILGIFSAVAATTQVHGTSSDVPINGMTMAAVERQHGAADHVRGPVGFPPITVWEYPNMTVYFEHNLVLVASGAPLTPEPPQPATQQAAPQSDMPSKPMDVAPTTPAQPMAKTIKVGYQPAAEDAASPRANASEVPIHGMKMAEVANRFGEPTMKGAPVGEPPITVWTYAQFKVFFENDTVLVAVIENTDPNAGPEAVVVGAEESVDLPQTDPQR